MGRTFIADPETILIILVICGVLFVMFNWASKSLDSSKENAIKDQTAAIECSSLDVRFIDRENNETHETVYLQANKPVEALLVEFRGDKNVTKVVQKVDTNSIVKTSAQIDGVSKVYAHVKGCERVFG